jgi:hypothetical protein
VTLTTIFTAVPGGWVVLLALLPYLGVLLLLVDDAGS